MTELLCSKEILGYSDDEVTQFLIDGVITTEHDVPDILKPKPKQATGKG